MRPINPPWMTAPIRPQNTNSEITVVAGLIWSAVMPRLKVIADEQGQGAFKAAKREGGQKENQNEQANLWLARGCEPIVQNADGCSRGRNRALNFRLGWYMRAGN